MLGTSLPRGRRAFLVLAALACGTTLGVATARTSGAATLAACQDTIAAALLRLDIEAGRPVAACFTRGIECLAGTEGARATCCADAARRCREDLATLPRTTHGFAARIAKRPCADVPFPDVLAAAGLGYADAAARCGALVPPVPAANLSDLAVCLERLVLADSVCRSAASVFPRASEAVACMDVAADLEAATGAGLENCASGGPSPTPGATPTPPPAAPCVAGDRIRAEVALDTAFGGAVVDLDYPPAALAIPGSAGAGSVAGRVSFAVSGLTAVNDRDVDGDGADDQIVVALAGTVRNPAGALATIDFDCRAGQLPPSASALLCTVESLSDELGTPISGAQCSVVLLGP